MRNVSEVEQKTVTMKAPQRKYEEHAEQTRMILEKLTGRQRHMLD